MTIDQIFAPSSNGQAYSIQDVLAAVGNQYAPKSTSGNQSIDEVLRGLTLGYNPVQAPTMPYGVAQYGGMPSESAMYTPAAFDKEALTAQYKEAAATTAYNDALAAGKSEAAARQEAAKIDAKWGQAGAMAGSYFFGPVGGFVGGQIGKELAPVFDDLTSGIGDIFGF